MEARFGHDFANVRVHTDAHASESAQSVDALAYTVGRDVVFAAGQYEPRSADGEALIAHELAHVVQQGPADSAPSRLSIGPANDPAEQEADSASQAVAAGAPVRIDAGAGA
jgi:Domain of unknown function (DUF4157)